MAIDVRGVCTLVLVFDTPTVGGHFLEWEEPELVARDMQTFFGALPR